MKGLVVFKFICFLVSLFTVLDAQTLDREVNTSEFRVEQIQKEKLSEKPYAFGVGVGYVKPERINWTFWLVANGRYKFRPNLAIELEIGYWRRHFQLLSVEFLSGIGYRWWIENIIKPSKATFSDFSVGGHMLFFPPEGKPFQVFMGGGLGIHFFKDPLGFLDYKSSKTKVKFGIRLLSGVEINLVKGFAGFVASRFDLVSDINQFKVYGGLCYKF